MVEKQGHVIGETFFLVYSPEREDPENPFQYRFYSQSDGVATACAEVGVALYEQAISEVVPVSSTRAAEMTKLLENIHRAVNIGLMNELKPLADRMGIDLYEVIRAAATKPFGFVPYYPARAGGIAFRSIPSISHGKPGHTICILALLSWRVRSTLLCQLGSENGRCAQRLW